MYRDGQQKEGCSSSFVCFEALMNLHYNLVKGALLLAFKGIKLSMLEFDAFYLPLESLFKYSESDMTI